PDHGPGRGPDGPALGRPGRRPGRADSATVRRAPAPLMTPLAAERSSPRLANLADTDTSVDLARRLPPAAALAGPSRNVAQIGVGGMGVVYKARDEELSVDIALKVLRPDMGTDPEWVARFRRELVLAREITHQNVVRIHDIGESNGLRFLTMRLV